MAACPGNDKPAGIGPLSLLSQPASPESLAFDHWESIQEEENEKEQGREAEQGGRAPLCFPQSLCCQHSLCSRGGGGSEREAVSVNLTCGHDGGPSGLCDLPAVIH